MVWPPGTLAASPDGSPAAASARSRYEAGRTGGNRGSGGEFSATSLSDRHDNRILSTSAADTPSQCPATIPPPTSCWLVLSAPPRPRSPACADPLAILIGRCVCSFHRRPSRLPSRHPQDPPPVARLCPPVPQCQNEHNQPPGPLPRPVSGRRQRHNSHSSLLYFFPPKKKAKMCRHSDSLKQEHFSPHTRASRLS